MKNITKQVTFDIQCIMDPDQSFGDVKNISISREKDNFTLQFTRENEDIETFFIGLTDIKMLKEVLCELLQESIKTLYLYPTSTINNKETTISGSNPPWMQHEISKI